MVRINGNATNVNINTIKGGSGSINSIGSTTEKNRKTPWYKKEWLWSIVAAILAVGGIVATFITASGK